MRKHYYWRKCIYYKSRISNGPDVLFAAGLWSFLSKDFFVQWCPLKMKREACQTPALLLRCSHLPLVQNKTGLWSDYTRALWFQNHIWPIYIYTACRQTEWRRKRLDKPVERKNISMKRGGVGGGSISRSSRTISACVFGLCVMGWGTWNNGDSHVSLAARHGSLTCF